LSLCCFSHADDFFDLDKQFDLDIPALNVAESLNMLAEQTNVILLFPYQDALSRQANALKGHHDLLSAIKILLDGSGLQGGFSKNGAIKISLSEKERDYIKTLENKTVNKKQGLLTAVLGFFLVESAVTPSFAQEEDDLNLEEVIVTGRKREETLQEIPVSISVLGENLITDAGIADQYDLFEMVPGLHYDETFSRNNAQASVRGVQQTGNTSKTTKVSSFIDGMPIIGSQGAIGFSNVQQVEVYRGPQSAAFGRSTFGGAINYITRDPSEAFEGNVSVNVNDYGSRTISASVGGPLTETLGYQLEGQLEDSSSPDEYIATDGVHYGERSGNNWSGKLVWMPNDKFEAELTFSHAETNDAPSVEYFITESARDACAGVVGVAGDTGIDSFITSGMGGGVYNIGLANCDWAQGAQIIAQNDRAAFLRNDVNGLGDLATYVAAARAAGASDATSVTGTVEGDILRVAEGLSMPISDVGSWADRDRVTLQLDYALDSGHFIQLSAMIGDEELGHSEDGGGNYTDSLEVTYNGTTGFYEVVDGNLDESIGADPTFIDETYVEVRWVSPSEKRFRYLAGASRYEYEYVVLKYDDGYGHVFGGFADEYTALTGDDPNQDLSSLTEYASNTGVFINLAYDITDKLTATIEGRQQTDDVEGVDPNTGNSGQIVTKSFIPRLSFNYNLSEQTSLYIQYAEGVNPGGVNTDFFNNSPGGSATLLEEGIPDGYGNNPDETSDPACTGAATASNPECNSFYVDYSADDFGTFEEESLASFEAGIKGSALGGKLQYSGAIYSQKWEGQTNGTNLNWDHPNAAAGRDVAGVTEITSGEYNPYDLIYVVEAYDNAGTRALVNGGDINMYGLELEGNYLLNSNWDIRGSFSYMQSEYTDYCHVDIESSGIGEHAGLTTLTVVDDGVLADCMVIDGKETNGQPEISWTLSPSFKKDINGMRFTARTDVRYESEQWRDVANVGKTPAVTTVNFSLGLSAGTWSTTLYVNNVLDEDTPRQFGSGTDSSITSNLPYLEDNNYSIQPRAPRTIGLRASYNF
jgi:outer membrane receptor protein involved in Fe transport